MSSPTDLTAVEGVLHGLCAAQDVPFADKDAMSRFCTAYGKLSSTHARQCATLLTKSSPSAGDPCNSTHAESLFGMSHDALLSCLQGTAPAATGDADACMAVQYLQNVAQSVTTTTTATTPPAPTAPVTATTRTVTTNKAYVSEEKSDGSTPLIYAKDTADVDKLVRALQTSDTATVHSMCGGNTTTAAVQAYLGVANVSPICTGAKTSNGMTDCDMYSVRDLCREVTKRGLVAAHASGDDSVLRSIESTCGVAPGSIDPDRAVMNIEYGLGAVCKHVTKAPLTADTQTTLEGDLLAAIY